MLLLPLLQDSRLCMSALEYVDRAIIQSMALLQPTACLDTACLLHCAYDSMIWQIILAIDDSLSMRENRSGQLACEALLVLNKALARLQVGQVTMRPVTISSSQPHSIDSETRALDSLLPRP